MWIQSSDKGYHYFLVLTSRCILCDCFYVLVTFFLVTQHSVTCPVTFIGILRVLSQHFCFINKCNIIVIILNSRSPVCQHGPRQADKGGRSSATQSRAHQGAQPRGLVLPEGAGVPRRRGYLRSGHPGALRTHAAGRRPRGGALSKQPDRGGVGRQGEGEGTAVSGGVWSGGGRNDEAIVRDHDEQL